MGVNCTIFAIGNELLEGSVLDTNSSYLAKNLKKLGADIIRVSMLKDNVNEIVNAFRRASLDSEIILTTGGLGPTFDDLTAEASATAFNSGLTLNEIALEHITGMLSSRGVSIKESHKRQAMLPEGCIIFENRVGTAHGFGVKTPGGYIISMPGIPYEMNYIFENSVVAFLKNNFPLEPKFSADIKFKGIPESDVDDIIRKIGVPEDVECIINVSKGEIIVRLRSFNEKAFFNIKDRIKSDLKDFFFGEDDDTLEGILFKMLHEKQMSFAAAESCTGGLLSGAFTSIPGSSKVFKGAVVVYSNKLKMHLLNVSPEILNTHGAVSAKCAESMVKGVLEYLNADFAISITGIAGPEGGTEDKPVGVVFIGAGDKNRQIVDKYFFRGDREAIRQRAVKTAFSLGIDFLKGLK